MAAMTKEEFVQHVKSDTLPMYRLAYSILQNSAAAEEVSFPLAEKYEFSIMTRVASDSEQDFSKKALVQRMEEKTNVTVDYKTIPEEQFDDKYKLALSKSDMPDVVTKMYI